MNFQDPLANVFVSGNNGLGTVIGNVFTENVKTAPNNLFYADIVAESLPPRRSVAEFSGQDFLHAVETFYLQSEQRPARFFRYDEEDLVMVTAQPDADLLWMRSLDEVAIRRLDKDVDLALLEKRRYRFECGCNQDQMLAMLAPVMHKQPDDLFEGERSYASTARVAAQGTPSRANRSKHTSPRSGTRGRLRPTGDVSSEG